LDRTVRCGYIIGGSKCPGGKKKKEKLGGDGEAGTRIIVDERAPGPVFVCGREETLTFP